MNKVVRFSFGSVEKNTFEVVKAIKTIVYQVIEQPQIIALSLALPSYAVRSSSLIQIDNSIYIKIDIFSHEYEAEMMISQGEEQPQDAEIFPKNRWEDIEKKQIYSVVQSKQNSPDISFEFNDYQEQFKRKNYTRVGLALNSLMSLDPNGSFVEKLIRLKHEIDECEKNRVTLLHKSLAFLLVFEDRYLKAEDLGSRRANQDLKYYYPLLDVQQFWASETEYILPQNAKKGPNWTIDLGFNVLDPDIYTTETFLRGLIPTGGGSFFDNLSEGQFKVLIAQHSKQDLLVALSFIVTHVLAKVHCAKMGSHGLTAEANYFDTYDFTLGLDWRFLALQQASPILILLVQILKSSPFGLQMIYLVNCYLNLLNCFKVVRIRLRKDWLFLRVELKKGNEHLPRNRTFSVINLSIVVSFSVASAQQVVFYIIACDLQQERTWSSSTPPLVLHDIIYLLQLISSRC